MWWGGKKIEKSLAKKDVKEKGGFGGGGGGGGGHRARHTGIAKEKKRRGRKVMNKRNPKEDVKEKGLFVANTRDVIPRVQKAPNWEKERGRRGGCKKRPPRRRGIDRRASTGPLSAPCLTESLPPLLYRVKGFYGTRRFKK